MKTEKLTLEHLAPYLPYGLKCQIQKEFEPFYTISLQGLSTNGVYGEKDICPVKFNECKPILRNLSDLTKEIEVNGEKFVPIDTDLLGKYEISVNPIFSFFDGIGSNDNVDDLPYCVIQKLYEWHFAINIPEHLYIDINTI